jgi:hypothetical protein
MEKWITAGTILGGLALAIGGVVALILWIQRKWMGRYGFKKKQLLTPNEVDFYRRLVAACGSRWIVLAQVSMGALMDTTLKPSHPRYWDARNKFSQKICDFVLCEPSSLKPVLIVELDDVMHDFKKDEVRDTLAARAGYQTLRFWSRKKPSIQELKQHIIHELALNSNIDIA